MDLATIMHLEVVAVGSAILAVLVGVRFVYLRFVMRLERTMPELLLMPRGLITVLLFYSIPPEFRLSEFSDGVVFFVIVAGALLMMVGLMVYRRTEEEDSVDDPQFLNGAPPLTTEGEQPDALVAAPKGWSARARGGRAGFRQNGARSVAPEQPTIIRSGRPCAPRHIQ